MTNRMKMRLKMIQDVREAVFRYPYLEQDKPIDEVKSLNTAERETLSEVIGVKQYVNYDRLQNIGEKVYSADINESVIRPKKYADFINGFPVCLAPQINRLEESGLVEIIRAVSHREQSEIHPKLDVVGNFENPTPWCLSVSGKIKDINFYHSVSDTFIDENNEEVILASLTKLGLEALFPKISQQKYDLALLETLSPLYAACRKYGEFGIQDRRENCDVYLQQNSALGRLELAGYLYYLRHITREIYFNHFGGGGSGTYGSSIAVYSFTKTGRELYKNLSNMYREHPLRGKMKMLD